MAGGHGDASGTHTDHDVIVGYPTSRAVVGELVLGEHANLRSGTVIYEGSTIGEGLQTGHHVVIREECVIGSDVSVWSNTVIDYGCRIGNRVKIHSNCYVAQFTEIGDDAFLAPGVTIANDLYPGEGESARVMCGPTIGAGAQIGVNVTLLPYVNVGAGALIGAGSVVTRDIPPGVIAFGNPARVHAPIAAHDDVHERIVRAENGDLRRFRLAPQQGEEVVS
jgi:acetyltransferase-like isoleucine patch superfamily enzyme